MYHNILTAKGHPLHGELQKAVDLIMAFSDISSVYFSLHIEEDLNAGIILFIIGDDSPHAWDELTESYWKIFNAFPQFSFRIFSVQWVTDELKNGNPFFAMHCTKNSLVYSPAETNEFNFVEMLRPKRFLKKAGWKFDRESHAAMIIGVDLHYYQRQKDHLHAAYNIHQNIRWLFIAASNFLTGEWFVAHDLLIHQKHVGRFSKELARTFNTEIAEEAHLLGLLNAACDAVQDGSEIPGLSVEAVKAAAAKKEWLRQEVTRLFRECVCRCRYEFSRSKTPLIAIDQSDPLKLITQIVTRTVSPSALYCFGQRSIGSSAGGMLVETVGFQNTHYYLFLLVDNFEANVPGNISYNIREETNGRYTATVVMHSKKSLHRKIGDRQFFFYQVLQRGRLLFSEAAGPPASFGQVPARNIASAKSYWEEREKTIDFFMEADAMDSPGGRKLHVYVLQHAVAQACLGLIRVFLGYMPANFSLAFLFDLCEYFTPLTAEIFPRATHKDKELLKLLSRRTASLHEGCTDDVPYHDYEFLSNRCNEFVDRAAKLAVAELERLAVANELPGPYN